MKKSDEELTLIWELVRFFAAMTALLISSTSFGKIASQSSLLNCIVQSPFTFLTMLTSAVLFIIFFKRVHKFASVGAKCIEVRKQMYSNRSYVIELMCEAVESEFGNKEIDRRLEETFEP